MGSLKNLGGRRIYLDTNVFIYALNRFPPLERQVTALFAAIDAAEIKAATSDLTLAELLVKPFRDGNDAAARECRALLEHPRLDVFPVSREVLVEAARLRATTALKLPDAIHVATAAIHGCGHFLSNDERLRTIEAVTPGVSVLLLADLLTD